MPLFKTGMNSKCEDKQGWCQVGAHCTKSTTRIRLNLPTHLCTQNRAGSHNTHRECYSPCTQDVCPLGKIGYD